jgi:hypothetical protein
MEHHAGIDVSLEWSSACVVDASSDTRQSRSATSLPCAVSSDEKTRLVTKLRRARERIRETQGKCEGRKSYAEHDPAFCSGLRLAYAKAAIRETACASQMMVTTMARAIPTINASGVGAMVTLLVPYVMG